MQIWPSGLRCYVQVVVCSHAWVQIPLFAFFLFPFTVICFILFAMCETSMHEECNGMCFAHNSYWFVYVESEIQGILVLIGQIIRRSKEGSDYAFWLICRLIVVLNQRAEVMFILFILSSQRYSLDSFWSMSVRIVELCKNHVFKVHQKVHRDAEHRH